MGTGIGKGIRGCPGKETGRMDGTKDREGIEGRVRLALYEAVALLDVYVCGKDLESLWRLKLALNGAIRDFGLNEEYYEEAFFPICVVGEGPRLLRPDRVVDRRKEIARILERLAPKGTEGEELGGKKE